ncbi:NUDIX domain-containing protein [Ornithinimicrobium avium]|uniref:NUDIX domain-containing protein n=1 Tax=Ornithinimicrobium avium TaxID=2283195 RepID=A0A345NM96_9MICO|nr:NUDIX domain-containing protein [Ornithinimicrobium avium]AXH96154.1 NUDIX domain-containing protein [Ornithinimicrobium avium]
MPLVRPATRGLVVAQDRLLVTVMRGRTGEFWLTPGGGQDFGESKVDNVAREVLEETGYRVRVGALACGRDYIGAHHFPEWDTGFQQTELWFWCELLGHEGGVPHEELPLKAAVLPDAAQTAVRWVPLGELVGSPLYPRRLASWLTEDPATRPVWLGDVN